jgi:ATP-binding cassette subfamily B protein
VAWAGGAAGAGFAGGQSSHQQAAAAGLPFGGAPPELADRIADIVADEPEHPEPEVRFSHSAYDRRPLTIRRLLGSRRWAVTGVLALLVAETVTMRIGPTLTQLAIDKGMGLASLGEGPLDPDPGYLVGVVVAYFVVILLAIGVGAARIRYSGRVGESFLYDLRVRVFSHFQRLSLDFFTGEKAGRLMTRMTSDIENLQQLFQEGMAQLLLQALTLAVLTVQLFLFSPRLALITFAIVVPVMTVMTLWFQRASDRAYLQVRDRIANVLSDFSESLAGIRVVAAHNRQRHNTDNHVNVAGDYREANDLTARIAAIYGPASEGLGYLATILVLLIGGNLVLRGEMDVGELTGFVLALAGFFLPIQQMAQLYNNYQQAQSGITKLRELLAISPTVVERPDAVPLPAITGRVRLDHVTFGYEPGTPVLHDVSLEIEPGETFALVGATGSGKSTIAKLVGRLYDPDEGSVLIDGHDLRDVTLSSLRHQLGVVPQEPFLFYGTVRDNIAFARRDASDEEVAEAARVVGLDDLLDRLPQGIDSPVHERGSSLSSGERQLLALARAFLARPRVLLLDEATSNLDLRSEVKVERALDVILEGRTAIIIAHRLATAMRADRIAVIHDGRVAELGSHEELVAHGGLYADMYAAWERHGSVGARPDAHR